MCLLAFELNSTSIPISGEIVGPVIGGALYEVGGFTLPFAVMGSILFLSSIFIYFVLPDTPRPQIDVDE